ncbi:MAG: DUF6273 domain-containing protein [Eubacterium sp.]|nr:DUF6273 domain-containing protein [Eubacterium sp.]
MKKDFKRIVSIIISLAMIFTSMLGYYQTENTKADEGVSLGNWTFIQAGKYSSDQETDWGNAGYINSVTMSSGETINGWRRGDGSFLQEEKATQKSDGFQIDIQTNGWDATWETNPTRINPWSIRASVKANIEYSHYYKVSFRASASKKKYAYLLFENENQESPYGNDGLESGSDERTIMIDETERTYTYYFENRVGLEELTTTFMLGAFGANEDGSVYDYAGEDISDIVTEGETTWKGTVDIKDFTVEDLGTSFVAPTTTPIVKKDTYLSLDDNNQAALGEQFVTYAWLYDENDEPLNNKKVVFELGNYTYTTKTNSEGRAEFSHTFDVADDYKLQVSFSGNKYYNSCSESIDIEAYNHSISSVVEKNKWVSVGAWELFNGGSYEDAAINYSFNGYSLNDTSFFLANSPNNSNSNNEYSLAARLKDYLKHVSLEDCMLYKAAVTINASKSGTIIVDFEGKQFEINVSKGENTIYTDDFEHDAYATVDTEGDVNHTPDDVTFYFGQFPSRTEISVKSVRFIKIDSDWTPVPRTISDDGCFYPIDTKAGLFSLFNLCMPKYGVLGNMKYQVNGDGTKLSDTKIKITRESSNPDSNSLNAKLDDYIGSVKRLKEGGEYSCVLKVNSNKATGVKDNGDPKHLRMLLDGITYNISLEQGENIYQIDSFTYSGDVSDIVFELDGLETGTEISIDSIKITRLIDHGVYNPREDNEYNLEKWDCIYFGSYPQSSDGEGGFVTEPIKWRVLDIDGDEAYLVADKALDYVPYSYGDRYSSWDQSNIRTWLNNDFYNTAFDTNEIKSIIPTVNRTKVPRIYVVGQDYNYCNTTDKVSLLDKEDVENKYGFSNAKTRECIPTEYAKDRGCNFNIENGNCWWWLRSDSDVDENGIVKWADSGESNGGGLIIVNEDHGNGVRPALHINLDSDEWTKAPSISNEGTIKNFRASGTYSKSAKLTWNKHSNDNTIKYVIKRDDVVLGETTDDYYIDTNLNTGQKYKYTICAITNNNQELDENSLYVIPKEMEFKSISTEYADNYIGLNGGTILITANKNNNYQDLYGNDVKGTLFYYDENNTKQMIGESNLEVSNDELEFSVNWDTTDVENGKYVVVFEYTDPDNHTVQISDEIIVDNTVPERITNVNAAGDYKGITVSWAKSSEVNSDKYLIYRKAEGEDEYSLLTTIDDRNTLEYYDQDVELYKTYSYYIVTKNIYSVSSDNSDEVTASLMIDTEPPVVTKITPSDNTVVNSGIYIEVKADDNVESVSSKIYYSTDNNAWTLIDQMNGDTPYSFYFNTTNVEDGDLFIKAVAIDAMGNESEARVVKYNVDNTGPGTVTGLQSKAIQSSLITLSWNDVDENDVSHFVLEMKNDQGEFDVIDGYITTKGYNIDCLKPNTEYTFRVLAVDKLGNYGQYSEECSVRTVADTTNPVIYDIPDNSGRVSGSDILSFFASANDDCGVERIELQASQDLINWEKIDEDVSDTYNSMKTSYFEIPLSGFKEGSLFLRPIAYDYSGNISDNTDTAPYVEYYVDNTPPAIPRGFTASGTDGYVLLSWIQGTEEDLSSYMIYRSDSENGDYECICPGTTTLNYFDDDVERNKTYYYKLAVSDTSGNNSSFTKTVSATTYNDVKPPEVVNVKPEEGTVIGVDNSVVNALLLDNNCLSSAIFEYKVNGEENYRPLKSIDNINYYYSNEKVQIPVDELQDGDIVHLKVKCIDIVGLESEDATMEYVIDKQAPSVDGLAATLDNNKVYINWLSDDSQDINGYILYREYQDGASQWIASRSGNSMTYEITDDLSKLNSGKYKYHLVVKDMVGNENSFYSNFVDYDSEASQLPIDKTPKAKFTYTENMEIGVEETFDASGSVDDGTIVSYQWNFGDGTTAKGVSVNKKFKETGKFEVTLTVTDDDGMTNTITKEVSVLERTALGTIKVKVLDEDDNVVSNAPVYFDMKNPSQKVVNTNDEGECSYVLESGEYTIGCYKSGYLPVTKTVKVLPNATRIITIKIIKEEIVTGKFEVTRMTFDEVQEAGINTLDPANQNVYKVRVTIVYCSRKIPVEYIRNDYEILDLSIGYGDLDLDGGGYDEPEPEIKGISFIPNDDGEEIIAVLMTEAKATTLKEFFNVDLYIMNHASSDFSLKGNEVTLDVPNGLTLMDGLKGQWSDSTHVEFDELKGGETHKISWCLRGDVIGDYDLSADYTGTLDKFNKLISARFVTDEPFHVYGMSNLKFNIEVNDEIKYNAFYFNIGLENIGDIDYYCPKLDYNQIVSNITASTLRDMGINNIGEDFDVDAKLLNIRYVTADGEERYIPYSEINNVVDFDLDTLAKDESIYFEYVAYNMIDYDGTAYFSKAATEELEGIGGGVEVRSKHMDLYSIKDCQNKFRQISDNRYSTAETNEIRDALSYILNNNNYMYLSSDTSATDSVKDFYDAINNNLELSLSQINHDDKKEVIKEILVEMMTDNNLGDIMDAAVYERYLSMAKDVLEGMKNQTDDVVVKEKINKALSDLDVLNSLSYDLMKASGSTFIDTFLDDLGLKELSNDKLEAIRYILTYQVTYNKSVELQKIVSKMNEFAGPIGTGSDILVSLPLEAYNDTLRTACLYGMIRLDECKEAQILLLNTLINNCSDNDVKEIARTIKTEVLTNSFNTAKSISEAYEGKVIEKALEKQINNILNKIKTPVKTAERLLSGATAISDKLYNIEDKLLFVQKLQILNAVSNSVNNGFESIFETYNNDSLFDSLVGSGIIDGINDDYSDKSELLSRCGLYELKYLCSARLIGESTFKKFTSSNDSVIVSLLARFIHDETFLREFCNCLGLGNNEFSDLYKMIYKNILSNRDILFNIEKKEAAIKPEAPEVTIDYNSLTTDQVFDNTFEYCFSDGIWITCTGTSIKVTPKTNPSVLRVRKRSMEGIPSGKIATVNIFAQKEISKNISVLYDEGIDGNNGTYRFKNLSADYTYQVCPLQNANDNPNWSNSVEINGGYNARTSAINSKSDYLAIRTKANADKLEMASTSSVLKVEKKKWLSIISEGNGRVVQPSDNGFYYAGDDVDLEAIPDEGYEFDGWYIDGEKVSGDIKYTIEMYYMAQITAKFTGGENVVPTGIDINMPPDVDCEVNNTNKVDATLLNVDKIRMVADVSPKKANDKTISWSIDNEEVATISKSGIITFKKPGIVTIKAKTSNGIEDIYVIKYINKPEETTPAVTTKNNTPPRITSKPNTKKTLAKPIIKKITKKKSAKKMKISLKKVNGAVGYQIRVYKTKKNANKDKKVLIKKNTKRIKTVITSKKLKNKKKLFVRVKAYFVDSNVLVFGPLSKTVRTRIK